MTPETTTGLANDIVTLGAGVVALAFIFGFIALFAKEGIPAFKNGVAAIIDVMDKMSTALDSLNKTMVQTQAANTAALEALKQHICSLELKLDYHIESAERIETRVNTAHTNIAEIRERVRSCGLQQKGAP